MNYLPVLVFSSGTDCSNDGISFTKRETLVVPCNTGHVSEEDVVNNKLTKLELIDRGPNIRDNFIPYGDTRMLMFGGNFIWSSDSRFHRTYGNNPIPIHDRYEN